MRTATATVPLAQKRLPEIKISNAHFISGSKRVSATITFTATENLSKAQSARLFFLTLEHHTRISPGHLGVRNPQGLSGFAG